jgi:diacylglycerol kinase family enzyme
MTSNEFADRLAAALGTVDLMGRALGLPRDPSFELARVSSDGLVVTVDTAGGQEEWEVKLRKLR